MGSSCNTSGPEANRYRPFTTAFNHALDELNKVELPGLRAAPLGSIYFHVSDPKSIVAGHESGPKTKQKPNISLVSSALVTRVDSEYQGAKGIDCSEKPCVDAPESLLKWHEILSVFELRQGSSDPLNKPPPQYLCESQDLVEPFKFGRAPDLLTATDGSSSSPSTSSSASDAPANSNKRSGTSRSPVSRKKPKGLFTCEWWPS